MYGYKHQITFNSTGSEGATQNPGDAVAVRSLFRAPVSCPLGNLIDHQILDNVPHLSYIYKNSKGGNPWVNHPQSELELNPI